MTTNRPHFRASQPAEYARCMGTNHNDTARRGTCSNCGTDIVKTEKGRLLNIHTRCNAADRWVEDYACWDHSHECNPETAALYQARLARALEAGDIIVGQHVTVIKGRKLAKGTTGTISWVGMNDYGPRVGIKTSADAEPIYTALTNVQATNQLGTEPVSELTAIVRQRVAPETTTRRGSHADCSHEATPAARAKCRKARQG
jgi:hypothetical protein